VAAELRKDGASVTLKRGGLGELRVTVDGRDVYDGNRLFYALPGRIVRAVRAATGDRETGRGVESSPR
jgi:hypothetical protein